MSDALVLTALLKHYKSQGIDLYHVLDDPLFTKLPLETKIDAVKANAAHILEGTSPARMSKAEILSKALQGAFGGAVTGVVVNTGNSLMMGRPITARTFRLGAGVGALLGTMSGGTSGVLSELSRKNTSQAMRGALQDVVHNPTDEAAIGLMSAARTHGLAFENTRKLLDNVSNSTNEKTRQIMPAAFDFYHNHDARKQLEAEEAAAQREHAAAQAEYVRAQGL